MKITKPSSNLICIYLDDLSEKPKAYKYLEKKKCVQTQFVPAFLVAAPEVWGQLKTEKQLMEGK
tara:strand:- start:520 stop:711 length:192 start_codon:yes stop_codon:yes gene_type:complete